MAASWHIRFFGGLVLQGPDRTITRFRTQKTAALLAYLAYHLGRTFPRETLVDMLWPGDSISGRHSLSTALTSLRRQVELPGLPADSVLVADRYCVALSADTVSTDVIQFRAALLRAERARNAEERIHALEHAVGLYQGEFLPGLYEEWVGRESLAHSERFANALCELTILLEKRGDSVAAIEFARRAIQADPLREEPYRELMRLYAGMGEPSTAVRYYHDLVQVFRTELDESPSPETRALAKKIQDELSLSDGSQPAETDSTRRGDRDRADRSATAATAPAGTAALLWVEITPADQAHERVATPTPGRLRKVLRREIPSHGGHIGTTPEGQHLGVFARAADAVACAAACQCALAGKSGHPARNTTFRGAIHTGDVETTGSIYSGSAVEHLAHLLTTACGGQILCSEATAGLLRPILDGGVTIQSIGTYRIGEKAVAERIYQINYPGQKITRFPPPRAAHGRPSNLPLQLPRFFGREEELRQLVGLLTTSDIRLITLAGPPGVGKSRLAIETGTRALESFGGAVWYVDVGHLRDAARIPHEILEALAIEPDGKIGLLTQLTRALAEERGLLILDDMEHLAAGAPLIRSLLEDCPQLRVLVTSRELLHLPGEREVMVAPLPIPVADDAPEKLAVTPSAQLLVDRARSVRPDFELTAHNAPYLAAICQQLEGLPLAIELAASCIHKMGFPDTLEFFAHELDLPINNGEIRTRHGTLRAALDWSFDRLGPDHQRFFACLAVFRGGWTAEAAEAVGDDPLALDHLADLADCSLIQTEHGPSAVRFRMLDLVREYALERLVVLGDAGPAEARHREFYLDLATRATADRHRALSAAQLEVLDAEHENMLAAIECFSMTPRCASVALRLAVALHPFWCRRGHLKLGLAVISRILSLPEAPRHSQLRAEALHALGLLSREQGACPIAQRHLEDSLAIYREHDDARGAASVLHELGILFARRHEWDRAQDRFMQALSLVLESGDLWLEARIRGDRGAAYLDEGRPEKAKDDLERAAAIRRQLDDKEALATQLVTLARALQSMGEDTRADSLWRECLAIRREIDDLPGAAQVLLELAAARATAGDHEAAARRIGECLAFARDLGAHPTATDACATLAETAAAIGRTDPADSASALWTCAVKLAGAAESLRGESQAAPTTDAARPDERLLREARAALGAAAFTSALAEGRAMSFDQTITYALGAVKELRSDSSLPT